ncbi:MAG: hypothetical protein GY711_26085 [bacterium]|nr:hypothetical protein [bacterium]
MQLAKRLGSWDGKDVAFLEKVYALYPHDAALAQDVFQALNSAAHVQTGATWLLKRHFESGARLDARATGRFLGSLALLEPWEARLHALQCMPFLVIPARSRAVLETFVREALESDVKFVRAWAFAGLHALAKAFEDLRPEAEALFDEALEAGPASVRARIRNLRKEGF